MKTPVALLLFNRPDTTARVFELIRDARPPVLLVIADGARSHIPEEPQKCAEARNIIQQVDWPCEIITNYSEVNLGCKKRVSSGLNWVFGLVEEAIILEDDCLPHPSFFVFCEQLLDYYRHDSKIGAITGQNVQFGRQRRDYSYYFSSYTHCWGWASWRRAWQHYDVDMKLWPTIRDEQWLEDLLEDKKQVKFWRDTFQRVYDGLVDTWDYQWTFSYWIKGYLNIIPNVNLVSNIGFGSQSTHTNITYSPFACIPTREIYFPLKHPPVVTRDRQADNFTQSTLYDPSLSYRINRKLSRLQYMIRKMGKDSGI